MKVRVTVKSEVSGEIFENETIGEYRAQNGEHYLCVACGHGSNVGDA